MNDTDVEIERIRKDFNRSRDAINAGFEISADQRAFMTMVESARKAGNPITYSFDKEKNTWNFQIGDQQMTISNPDIAAAGIGAARQK